MKKLLILLHVSLCLGACHTVQKTSLAPASTSQDNEKKTVIPPVYHGSNTLSNDLHHTRLEVRFDWTKKQLIGKAELTLTAYFYPTNRLVLHARGMEIKELGLLDNKTRTTLKYEYRNDSLDITLNRIYKKGEKYSVFIDYIAKPEELKAGGSLAITSDKGLYFINADGKDEDKPMQIWTQGETQASSAWFPTIDAPNERMTQELFITIDTSFTTLSNGLLLSSVKNADGTRTDYWKQSLPAAPYLTMMAIGKYAIVTDKWRGIDVSYYVEPAYEKYARRIFGNTPEMLEFFSTCLGVDYPWEKYAQVIVRDYVSGAMENTTAVIHGDFIQQEPREMLDNSYEDVISHELFHHWFGNLVTCESWSNISLNESFATYGQYLWNEYKYGRDEADYGIQQDLNEYITLGRGRTPHLVRFDYTKSEDLFDAVSYQKGGRILHMLRKVVGDEAFFASLKLYLNTNKYKSVEAHQLRLAFEEITGQDMNWFFNEWFFSGGHPELKISYAWDDSLKQQYIYVSQQQDFENTPLYRMPVEIDLYFTDTIIRKEVVISQVQDTFIFNSSVKPLLVNFDSEKMLVAQKTDLHSADEWLHMFNHAPLYMDRYESLNKLAKKYTAGSQEARVVLNALSDPYWNIRMLALKNIEPLTAAKENREQVKTLLTRLVEKDPKSDVRMTAVKTLARYYENENLNELLIKASNDSSYDVTGEAIRSYLKLNPSTGLAWVKQFESSDNRHISAILGGIYAENGSDENNSYLIKALQQSKGFGKYHLVSDYVQFLERCKASTIQTGISEIERVARTEGSWWVRMGATQALTELLKSCEEKSTALTLEIRESATQGKQPVEIQMLENDKKNYDDLVAIISEKIADIKKNETDSNLKKIYSGASN